MKKILVYILCISTFAVCCESDPDTTDPIGISIETGTIDFSFVYHTTGGIPESRVKRLSLRMAYTEDSLNHGLFFTSSNVSDVVSKYQILLPEGTYYYQATIICLCALDSCKYSGFTGQYGTRAVGNRVEVFKNQITEVTTQFQ